ncbi:hypothetical protein [Tateyamaria sp. SN6-1]|uniref:hypothetical protein n=1 Tax=Tateyamaria sp. SN6-1 TaxID=3092148 RepID=UPI0039F551C7
MTVSVLLIEDNAKNLKAKKTLLSVFGCGPVVGVADPDSAVHAMRTLPHFDLVIADIDLSQSPKATKAHNKGGIDVARWLKQSGYPAYVAGYSSHFADDEISSDERSVFDDMVDRGMVGEELDQRFEDWIARASERDRGTRLGDLLVEAYASVTDRGDRVSAPVVAIETLISYDDDEEVQQIRDAGYTLNLLLPTVNDQIRKAIPIWTKVHDGGVNMEVVGQPYLFSEGATADQAKENLVDLIQGYHTDLADLDPETEMGPYVRMLSNFIGALFR